jgi:thioredoxin-like negative regulator of GroEL
MRILCPFVVLALAILITAGCNVRVPEKPIAQTLAPELKEGEPDATVVLFSRAQCQGVPEQRRLLEMMVRRTNGKIVKKEVDVGSQRGLGEMYGVRSVPTVSLFNKDGKLVFYKDDVVTEEEIVRELNKLGIEVVPLPAPEGGAPSEGSEKPAGTGGS